MYSWLLLLGVMVVNVPAFLCMGLDADVYQWDLNTRAVLEGRALYRDAYENNLPGMLVPLVVIRSLFGWGSEVLRLADLAIVGLTIGLLSLWLPAATRSQRLALAATLLVFYFSTSEWCHCQRDVWMLLPALAALSLRWRQVSRVANPHTHCRVIATAAFIEGFVWAVAFWIKPFVAVPALLCWLLSARLAWTANRWRLALDGGGVLAGGLAAGAAGCAWLVGTGAWPAFTEIMFVWNREYLAYDITEGQWWLSWSAFVYRLFPWVLVHVVAVPLALSQVYRAATRQLEGRDRALLAGLYLGWLFQSVCLQHLFDYVQAPAILLGLTVMASWCVGTTEPRAQRLVLAFVVVCVLVRFPGLCATRLSVWDECLRSGSTPELRDRLTLLPKQNWSDLDRVNGFLRDLGVEDGELNCMNMATISLYGALDVRPATRFAFLQSNILRLSRQKDLFYGEVAASRQRFMVCDAHGFGMEKLQSALDGASPYPWLKRIVFRSGSYVVFDLSGPETQTWFNATSKRPPHSTE